MTTKAIITGNDELSIVMYHYTRDLIHSRYPNIKGLDIQQFKKQIDFLKNNYNIVRMEEVMAAIEGSYKLPEKAMLLTFDDGYIDNYTYALPILNEAKVQGSFFIPGKTFAEHTLLDVNKIHYMLASANINDLVKDVFERLNYYRGSEFDYPENDELFKEYAIENRFDNKETIFVKRVLQTVLPEDLRNQISSDLFEKYVGVTEEQLAYELYLTENQVREMKRQGMHIGIHGYDHYWLANLPKEKMKEDITKALNVMDEFIDKDKRSICYPYGNYNEEVIDFIKENGAKIGLTTEVRKANLSSDNQLKLPRFDCNDYPPKSNKYLQLKDSNIL